MSEPSTYSVTVTRWVDGEATELVDRYITADQCNLVSEPPPDQPDHRSLRERVQELWEGGLCVEEIWDYIPDAEMAEISAIHDDLERRRKD